MRPVAGIWGYMIPWLLCGSLLAALGGCRAGPSAASLRNPEGVYVQAPFTPSHQRRWQPAMAVLPYAEIHPNSVKVHNIRNCYWFSENVYTPRYYDREFLLDDLQSVDFLVVPFKEAPDLAHTMLSFGFQNGYYLGVSVEARLEEGEAYSPLAGVLGQFELMYVVADERDLIQLRTEHRQVDVYLYRTRVAPQQVRALFVDMMKRVNQIYRQPEFYHTLYNNCTTNIVRHVNHVRPGRVPFSLALLLTGHSDRLAYDLGLLDTDRPFEETRRLARINDLARRYRYAKEFSSLIRR